MRAALWTVIGLLAASFGTIIALVNSRIGDARDDIKEVKGTLAQVRGELVAAISQMGGDLSEQLTRVGNDLHARVAESRQSLTDLMDANNRALRSDIMAEMKIIRMGVDNRPDTPRAASDPDETPPV